MPASPLVTAYLADLDRALAGADPADRLEIVDAVREHIDAALAELGASPAQAEIAALLRRLGTADEVAAAWAVGADRPTTTPTTAAWGRPADAEPLLRPTAHGLRPVPPEDAPVPPTSPWIKALVVIVGLALGVPVLLGILASAFLVATSSGTGWGYHHVTPGWAAVTVVVALVTLILGLAARRRTVRHRRIWGTAFVVGLVLVVVLVPWGLHMGGYIGGRYDGTLPYVVPSPGIGVPTPAPAP